MAALLALLPAAGHDQLWFLLMSDRWLHGATLYGPEIFDSNTPAIVWLGALPVTLAQHLHLPIPPTAKLCATLLFAALAALCRRILLCLDPTLSPARQLFLLFTFILLAAVIPARDLGQRDHLTALLLLPYLLAAALPLPSPSSQPKRSDLLSPNAPPIPAPPCPALATSPSALRLLAGLLAALACCLKPQQALVPLTLEAALLLHANLAPRQSLPRRLRTLLRRPEPALLLLVGALFLAAIHTLTPLFFTLTLPTLLQTYWAIGHLTPAQLLLESIQLHLLALVTLALTLRHPRSLPANLLTLAGLAATLAYYLQGTGWYYQQLPAITFFTAALALHALPLLDRLRLPRATPLATAALVLLALALTTHFTGYPFTPDRAYSISTPDPTLFRDLPPGTPIATLTTSVDDAIMPVVRYHLTWSQRTNNLWTLPAILRSLDPHPTDLPLHARQHLPPAQAALLAARQRQWMVQDLRRWQPRLVLVARCQAPDVQCQELEDRHDDLLAFFLADPAFRTLWQQHYRLQRTAGPYDAYTLATPF